MRWNLVGAVVLVTMLAACGSSNPNTAATTPSTLTPPSTTTATTRFVAPTPVSMPITITPKQGRVPYLNRTQNGSYLCGQYLTTITLAVNAEQYKEAITAFQQLEFKVTRVRDAYAITYPGVSVVVPLAIIIDDKSGFDLPGEPLGDRSSGSSDPLLRLNYSPNERVPTLKLCAAVLK